MKITVIGGGSLLWALGFARQIINSAKLRPIQLVLYDIDVPALDLVASAARRYNKACGNPVQIKTSVRLEPALAGADFVLVSIATGGLKAMRPDVEIPEKYGIYHTVGDTVGPGGWLRAVRNIPVFNRFAEIMKQSCPRAWMLNVSNPLSVLTRVPQLNFGIQTIGICPGVENAVRMFAGLAGAPETARLDYVVTGIDHGSWLIKLYADGMDVLRKLKEQGYCRTGDRPRGAAVEINDPVARHQAGVRAGFAVWREIGYLPSIADRHTIENWPWFLASRQTAASFGIKRTSIANREKNRQEARRKMEAYAQAPEEKDPGSLGHGDDPVASVMEALSGYGSFMLCCNYMNIGQIEGFPPGAVVETRCLIDAAGVHPLCSPMPDVLKILVLPHVLRQEAIIDIALHGNFDELVALVTTDPLCSRLTIGQGRAMVKKMLNANRALIQNPRLLEW